jgi:hypothetical protein
MRSRREFLTNVAVGTAGMAVSLNARSYARILGANDRVNFAIVGLHGRGQAHLECIREVANTQVTHICDVDAREFAPFSAATEKAFGQAPLREKDVRKLLESKDVDAITIATPEHWHAPMALLGLASTSTSRNRRATTPTRANCSSPRRRNTASSCSLETSSDHPRTRSRSWGRSRRG